MSMEEDIWFMEDIVNEMSPTPAKEEFTPKYSILRMM